MISFNDIKRVLTWTKATNNKVIIKFEKTPYFLAIDRLIHAEDEDGRSVPWMRAFGPKQPHQVLSSYKVKEIMLVKQNGSIESIKDLKELFRIV